MIQTLLDHQVKYSLIALFFSYILLISDINSKSNFITICDDSFKVSQSVNLTVFSCCIFFLVFAAQQFIQLFNYINVDDIEVINPLIKVNFSNMFVCFVCSTMFYKCFIDGSTHICKDAIGFWFYIVLVHNYSLNKSTKIKNLQI
jgi:hypothetical protein